MQQPTVEPVVDQSGGPPQIFPNDPFGAAGNTTRSTTTEY
jgi:hypothetical protein